MLHTHLRWCLYSEVLHNHLMQCWYSEVLHTDSGTAGILKYYILTQVLRVF